MSHYAPSLPSRTRHSSALLAVLVTLILALVGILAAGPANAATKPGRPSAIVGTGADQAVSLTWTPPADGGSPISEYRVRYSKDGGATWSSAIRTMSATPSYTMKSLTNGVPHLFKVRAFNSVGGGLWSLQSAPITPTAPTSVTQPPAPDPGPTPSTPQTTSGSWWAPAKGTTWQWQLTGTIDTSVPAAVFDVDGEDTSAATVATLHAKGSKVICYFSAGSWEDWRSDSSAFPASVKGNTLDGWPDEKWLDVRQLNVLLPIMEKRIANCKAKGFDAVEPDNVDGYSNSTGFPLTAADQIAYNRALADLAHKHGLGVALKNDPEQVKQLEPYFDFSVAEECARYNECAMYAPFTAAGKAVLHVEYRGTLDTFCPVTKPLGFSSMLKNLDLTAWRDVCP